MTANFTNCNFIDQNHTPEVMDAIRGMQNFLGCLGKLGGDGIADIGRELVNLSNDLPHKVAEVIGDSSKWSEQEKRVFLQAVWGGLGKLNIIQGELSLDPNNIDQQLGTVHEGIKKHIRDQLHQLAAKQAQENGTQLQVQMENTQSIVNSSGLKDKPYDSAGQVLKLDSPQAMKEAVTEAIKANEEKCQSTTAYISELQEKINKLDEDIKIQKDNTGLALEREKLEQLQQECYKVKSTLQLQKGLLEKLEKSKSELSSFSLGIGDSLSIEDVKSKIPELYPLVLANDIAMNVDLHKEILNGCEEGARLANLFTVGDDADRVNITNFLKNSNINAQATSVDELQEKVISEVVGNFYKIIEQDQNLVIARISGNQELFKAEELARQALQGMQNLEFERLTSSADIKEQELGERQQLSMQFQNALNAIMAASESAARDGLTKTQREDWGDLQQLFEQGKQKLELDDLETASRVGVDKEMLGDLLGIHRHASEELEKIKRRELAKEEFLASEELARSLISAGRDFFDNTTKFEIQQAKKKIQEQATQHQVTLERDFGAWVTGLSSANDLAALNSAENKKLLEKIRATASKLSDTDIKNIMNQVLGDDSEIKSILLSLPLKDLAPKFTCENKAEFYSCLGDVLAGFTLVMEDAEHRANLILKQVSSANILGQGQAQQDSLIALANDLPHSIQRIIYLKSHYPPGAKSFF